MDTFLSWIGQQAIGILAFFLAIGAWIYSFRLRRKLQPLLPQKIGKAADAPEIIPTAPPQLAFYPVDDRTHAIRNQKLVNRLSLHFRNLGGPLYYDNVEFERHNKRLEVEILAEKELEIFTDPRDDQRIEPGEALRITFEREIGDQMGYRIKVYFEDTDRKLFYQTIEGTKGRPPLVSAPKAAPQ